MDRREKHQLATFHVCPHLGTQPETQTWALPLTFGFAEDARPTEPHGPGQEGMILTANIILQLHYCIKLPSWLFFQILSFDKYNS